MRLSEYLIEAVAKRESGKYERGIGGKPYSEMTFNELCNEMSDREYYYQMSRKEGDMFVDMILCGQHKYAWRFLLDDVRGGDGLWFKDAVNTNIWIIGISSHSAYVYEVVYDYGGKNIESVKEFYIPVGKKYKLWTGSNLADGKEMIDKLLEK